MTYGRVHRPTAEQDLDGAAVSHMAELVRGESSTASRRPPHPPLRGTFSPRGEGSSRLPEENSRWGRVVPAHTSFGDMPP